MKRLILLLLLTIVPFVGHSQVSITMEETGGVYRIPCTVNGVKMKFIFDTGASAVSLSQTMADVLFDGGYLSEKDVFGTTQMMIADGSIVDVKVINLRDFEVGGFHLSNVRATIKKGQNVPLLMGQSAIEKLGRISIAGNKLIIHKPKVNLTASEIATLRKEIQTLFKSKDYDTVIDNSERLKNATEFDEMDFYYYIESLDIMWLMKYHHSSRNNTMGDIILSLLEEWESSGIKTSKKMLCFLYKTKASCISSLRMDESAHDVAINCYRKALEYSDSGEKVWILSDIAGCYIAKSSYGTAEKYVQDAIKLRYKLIGKNLADALEGRVNDACIGMLYWQLADTKWAQGDHSQRVFYMRLSAKCGDETAIDWCFQNNINYTQ